MKDESEIRDIQDCEDGAKNNEKSKNSTLLEQILSEGLHDTPAHHAHCASAVCEKYRESASDSARNGKDTQSNEIEENPTQKYNFKRD